ncbi:hypothetical protein LFZ56_13370 [Salmonella bongori serovar 66:z41:- str. SA19983605]|uniref:Uncharacterized protein n=1 Tax=Salmonella bongori serovar 66:z41:- str. SA19983605 TaxID=1243617 RepID=A0A248KAT5_SALBN|nr:hypothetical protein LFZ56_13370 [Salmonella bongori serovar 66:z41:- str. SA19983605]
MYFFSSRPNKGVVDIPPASYCSVIHTSVNSYILTTIIYNFSHFIQCSEQIKASISVRYIRLKRSMKAFCLGLPSQIATVFRPLLCTRPLTELTDLNRQDRSTFMQMDII